MPKTVTVFARIDEENGHVVLDTALSGLRNPRGPLDTFLVQPGDTLEWDLRDAEGASRPFHGVQVRVVSGPIGGPSLLTAGDLLKADGKAIISSTVSEAALDGHYLYKLEQVGPDDQVSQIVCFWNGEDGVNRTGMAGGEKEPSPIG